MTKAKFDAFEVKYGSPVTMMAILKMNKNEPGKYLLVFIYNKYVDVQ